MREYLYTDVPSWITPDHGLNTVTLTMVVAAVFLILIAIYNKDK